MTYADLLIVITAWIIGAGSPGPATLAISATAVQHGRKAGLTISSGILAGSACWGIAAALGISSLMVANAWAFEVVRYFGAAYLLYLAVKSLKNALHPAKLSQASVTPRNLFIKGMLLHITNPKAILAWGSVYAVILPPNASLNQVAELFLILIIVSALVFLGYGFLFSIKKISNVYRSLKRWFELAFGLLFGAASLRLLTSRIEM